MRIETSNWSGEGTFTQVLVDRLQAARRHRGRARRGRAGEPLGGRLQLHQQRDLRGASTRRPRQERAATLRLPPA